MLYLFLDYFMTPLPHITFIHYICDISVGKGLEIIWRVFILLIKLILAANLNTPYVEERQRNNEITYMQEIMEMYLKGLQAYLLHLHILHYYLYL